MSTAEPSSFSFVQINDIHITTPDKPDPRLDIPAHFRDIVETINSESRFPLPDFVIVPGDIVFGMHLEDLTRQCEIARDMLSALRCPYYPVVGNHDVIQPEDTPETLESYKHVFGADRLNYHFEHKGLMFVAINNWSGQGDGNPTVDDRNQWLENVLKDNPDIPKIIACHVPLIPMRDQPILKASFGFKIYTTSVGRLQQIIHRHAETILAVLCGHLHLTSVVRDNDNIYHICTSGPVAYPGDYAHYTVHNDRIDVRMCQIADHLVANCQRIHGKPRHDHDFTDAKHATAEQYVSGTKHERQFSIPIP